MAGRCDDHRYTDQDPKLHAWGANQLKVNLPASASPYSDKAAECTIFEQVNMWVLPLPSECVVIKFLPAHDGFQRRLPLLRVGTRA